MKPRLLGLRHAAIYVRDLERSLTFYCDVMGLRLEWRPNPENAYLTSGGDNLALHQLPSGAEPGEVQFLDHIGFAVPTQDDVDKWASRLSDMGIDFVEPPATHRDGARSFYFHDPDGILIQIIHHLPISDSK